MLLDKIAVKTKFVDIFLHMLVEYTDEHVVGTTF